MNNDTIKNRRKENGRRKIYTCTANSEEMIRTNIGRFVQNELVGSKRTPWTSMNTARTMRRARELVSNERNTTMTSDTRRNRKVSNEED